MERKSRVMSAPAYVPTCLSYYSLYQQAASLLWRPETETIRGVLFFMSKRQKPWQKRGSTLKSLATRQYFSMCFHLFSAMYWIHGDFLCLKARVHIFIQCRWFNESDHLGAPFCSLRQSEGLCRTDQGDWDHKGENNERRGDNKSHNSEIPSVALQRTM